MKSNLAVLSSALFAIQLLLVAGCGSQDPPNGTVACGAQPHPCPEGYQCSTRTKTCWKGGIEPAGDAGGNVGGDAFSPSDSGQPSDGFAQADGSSNSADGRTDGNTADLATGPQDALNDTPSGDDRPDVSSPDLPLTDGDARLPDAPSSPDTPIVQGDAGATCPSPKVSCGGQCVDLSAGGCCAATDCSGSCMTCTTDHTCAPLKGMDDPTNRCAGTCDATGACKAKKGQACQSATACVSGTTCADGYCCDKACSGTCEACDVANALGTCTTLSSGAQPRAGRTACTGSGTCVGTCNGASPACFYTTAACGTATCTSTNYQAAGTCNQGTCAMPAVQSCSNACVVASGGCTGVCSPTAVKCSATGVPQLCSSAGGWQDQTDCQNGFTCSAGACACASPKTTCGSTCSDLQTDSNNCGTCGHGCLGGTCALGMCQPIAVTGNLASAPTLFGIDATYLYYYLPSTTVPYTADAYRISRSTTGAAGSMIYTSNQGLDFPYGVVGTKLIIYDAAGLMSGFTIGGSATTKSPLAENIYGMMMPHWRSLQPTNYAQIDSDQSTAMSFRWYNSSNSLVATYSESTLNVAPTGGFLYFSFFAAGNTVYWIRQVQDSSYSATAASGLYATTSSAPTTRTQLAGGTEIGGCTMIDANSVSIILLTPSTYYDRVPLPAGVGTSYPQSINTGSTTVTEFATEDANGFYWADTSGNINRCASVNCLSTSVVLATGQGTLKGFYQDATALYWARTSPNQIIRLAK